MHTNTQNQYARAVLECDDFFLKFLDAFKKFKASEQAAAWVADKTLVFEVRLFVCV